MAKHIETGAKGEDTAAAYLIRKGYAILQRNWKADRCEIDIIARQGDIIVFVEVKARSNAVYGWPEDAVSEAKQENIANAAEAFLLAHNMDNEIRFDIVSVISAEKGAQVYHIQDAFAP